MVINLGKSGIFQQFSKTLLNFYKVRLSFQKAPLAKLKTNLFKIDMTELIDKPQNSVKVLKGAIIDMCCMKP